MNDCTWEVPADALRCQAADPFRLAAANINPLTGLSTDYLNHFNEAVMLLELLPGMPECAEDLAHWRPLSYRAHFAQARLHASDLVIAAYELAEPDLRARFDCLCESMEAMIVAAQEAVARGSGDSGVVAAETAATLKPLLARASAFIHGHDAGSAAPASIQAFQAAVDAVIAP